jgi:8-oxo-dGTP pyrophosphatase MutT (NUDIX family)
MPTLGVFAAIFDDSGRILCVRMNYATRAWTTPGGRVEVGESPFAALRREVLEESGLDAKRKYRGQPSEYVGAHGRLDRVGRCHRVTSSALKIFG